MSIILGRGYRYPSFLVQHKQYGGSEGNLKLAINTKIKMSRQLGKQRAMSAGPDAKVARQMMAQLRQELLECKSELQKTTDQLNCLVMLVKRAWTGDKAAAIHVANVVGVAPPDFEGKENNTITPKPKTRSLQNWALLTIGLLQREYKALEREVQDRQKIFFQSRQGFLEEQLIQHRDMLAVGRGRDGGHKRTSTVEEVDRLFLKNQKKPDRVQSAKKTSKHLYRSPQREAASEAELTWADLFIEPVHNKDTTGTEVDANKDMSEIFQLTGDGQETGRDGPLDGHLLREENSCSSVDNDPDRVHLDLDYDDPHRYTQSDLFDKNVLGVKKNRPVSAVQQRSGDAKRARPKSAVIARGERPLKYVTTRPVSAQVTNKLKKDKISNEKQQDSKNRNENKPSPGSKDVKKRRPPSLTAEQLAIIRRPECVDQFEEDVKRMHQMEEEIKRATKTLQKKLGISGDGAI
ncbi:uncharacterized protein LOC106154267 [Lingula anatina]|uniref:Uncharacterized protein LOC106154267 n=1 Tax=Lingula anatina TaxID=7574 RepID=A0A1S3HG62_LINAN|nr:uncharacterized protein LOC106154267 [Lingula anatina]|eukprot:XP_013384019.1 uncharacterized protein LOC106154267 [Lingula anatina]